MGVETTFTVQVIVEADGTISEPLLLKPILEPAMIYAVYEAMRQWKFKPATLNGRSIPVYWNLTVNFEVR